LSNSFLSHVRPVYNMGLLIGVELHPAHGVVRVGGDAIATAGIAAPGANSFSSL